MFLAMKVWSSKSLNFFMSPSSVSEGAVPAHLSSEGLKNTWKNTCQSFWIYINLPFLLRIKRRLLFWCIFMFCWLNVELIRIMCKGGQVWNSDLNTYFMAFPISPTPHSLSTSGLNYWWSYTRTILELPVLLSKKRMWRSSCAVMVMGRVGWLSTLLIWQGASEE